MASTYDLTVGGNTGVSAANSGQVLRVEKIIDFSLSSGPNSVNSGSGTIVNDVIQVIDVPAYSMVLSVGIEVMVASANLDDLDVGDGDQVDDYIDGHDCTSVGKAMGVYDAADPRQYTSADTIDIKQIFNGTVVTGKIKIVAMIIDMFPDS